MARIDSMRAPHHAVRNRKNAFERRDILNTLLLPHMAACLASLGGLLQSGALYAAEPEEPLVEIVVTGSRLSSANATSPSPIVVLDNEELLHQGTARAEDLLNSLPQVNSGLTLGANGNGVAPLTGTATADLRGIGAFRTLVLVNGKRAAPGDPINPSADLNTVPSTLVKRVEVLTGGASAVYGSDAVAGVVNFILDTNFTGFKFDVEGAINRGSNDRTDLQAIERASGVNPRTGAVYDGASTDVSVVFGKDLFGGSGHVTAFAGYRHAQAVSGSSRDFSACTLVETGNSFSCQLDGTTPAGQFVPNGGTPLTLDTANGHAFRTLNAPADLFNPAPYQYLQRPDARYNAGVFGSYKFNDAANLYTEAMYTDDRTTVRYEPVGTAITGQGLPTFNINCNNPLLSASQVFDLCTSAGLGPTQAASVMIGRRNVEGGQRADEFHHQSYRLVLGLKGALSDPWTYDASVTYGRVNLRETLTNDFSSSRLANALNVVAVGGVPTCQSVVDGTDPACVPYNIYSVGGVTPAALKYLTAGGSTSGFAQRTILTAQVIGDLDKYGIKSPIANSGFGVAAGGEYRVEQLRYDVDAGYASGDLLTSSSGGRATEGTFRVGEVFAEMKMPLIEDRPFAKALVLNGSDRYAHYTPQGNVNAYGLGLEWAPVTGIRARGSVSRAVRAPNAYELFSPRVLGQFGYTDPCAGSFAANAPQTPTATFAQCARTGVTQAQYGNISAQNTINQVIGGNPNLKPEIADTVTMGFVLTPLSNMLFSADYWRIKVNKYLGGISPSFTVSTCLNTGDPTYCSLIQRDASGSLSSGIGAAAGRVLATRFNTGSYGTSGVDFEGRYFWNLDPLLAGAGSLNFSFTGSIALKNPIDVAPGATESDCTGYFGPNCTGIGPTSPVPRWRHRLRTTWQTKHDFELSLNWRHIGPLRSEFTSGDPNLTTAASFPIDSHIGSYDYFDLDGSIDITPHFSVRAGVNNLADRKPPIIGFTANPQLVNGNMAAGMYDALGRYLFAGFTAKY
jgi:outer membrane receptor protein involved in Fe transport